MAYTKLFNSILDSTVWENTSDVRIVWITMLAMADRDGEVMASMPGLAKRAGVSRDVAEKAIKIFLSPDRDSRSREMEGRRIREIDGGWLLVNYGKYRDKSSIEEIREKAAKRQAAYRERNAKVTQSNVSVTVGNDAVMNGDASNDIAEAKHLKAEAEETTTTTTHARTHAETEREPQVKQTNQPQHAEDQDLFSASEAIERAKKSLEHPREMRKTWQDWRILHPRIFIARTGDDGDVDQWRSLFLQVNFEKMTSAYGSIKTDGKIFFSNMIDALTGRNNENMQEIDYGTAPPMNLKKRINP